MGIRKYSNPIIGTIYGQWTIISTEIKNNGSNNRSTYYKVRCQGGKEGWRAATNGQDRRKPFTGQVCCIQQAWEKSVHQSQKTGLWQCQATW